jgi:ATP-dependent protease ClpP protease subunit
MPIRLNLCSTGGSVFAGLGAVSTIFDLQREGRKVNVHVQGLAASMASVIMQAADYRTIESTAHILLHKISYGMRGSADEHQEELEFTNNLHQSMFSIYSARTGKPVSYYFEKLKKTNWFMTAETALAEGLVDEVVPPPRFLPAKAEKPKKATKRAA